MAQDGAMPSVAVSNESPNFQQAKAKIAELAKDERLPGFPFAEPWPLQYIGKRYEIILVNGDILVARVDDSREFMSEGREWKTTANGNKTRSVVAGWKEVRL